MLRQVGSTAAGYVITGPNGATAGTPTTITIQKVDAYGNPIPGGSTETLIFTGLNPIGEFAPTVNGAADAFTTGIMVVFDENGTATVVLVAYSAGESTINVTNGNDSSAGNGGGLPVAVSAGTASTVSLTPSGENLVYGSTFDVTIESRDAYGNLSTTGLPSNLLVTLDGAGLIGSNLTQDIGTSAGNGSAVYTGVQAGSAGQNTIVASSSQGSLGSITILVNKLALVPAAVVSDKVYDGTTAALIIQTSLGTVLAGDDVQLNGTAAFENKHVGPNKTVIVSALTLAGSDAQNYDLTTTTLITHASITPRHVTVKPNSDKKTYDGTQASKQAPAVENLVDGDSAEVVQFFADKKSGQPKTLIPAGALADGNNGNNYVVLWKDEANGVIEPRLLTINATATSKVYDGMTTAQVSLSDDRLAGDDVVIKYASAEFGDSNVGIKQVVVSGITLEGPDAQNYIAPSSVITTAEITKAPLSVSADDKSREFGVANPILTGNINGMLGGDVLSLTFSTPAQPTSRAGAYSITPEIQDPQNRLANYAVTISPGVLTVLQTASSIEVLASAYPSLEGSNVTLHCSSRVRQHSGSSQRLRASPDQRSSP